VEGGPCSLQRQEQLHAMHKHAGCCFCTPLARLACTALHPRGPTCRSKGSLAQKKVERFALPRWLRTVACMRAHMRRSCSRA
jgi:hypothetical protein